MNSMMKKAAITGAAAAAAVGLGMGPAAAGTVTIAGGPNFHATSTGTVTLTAGVSMSCASATADGSVTTGAYTVPGTKTIGSITGTTWTSCTALGAPSFPSQTGTWNLDVTNVTDHTKSPAETPGQISNVNATVSIPSVGCTLTVTGVAGGKYVNGPVVGGVQQDGQLVLTGGNTLNIAKSGFCLGVNSTGSFTATYNVHGTDSSGNPSPITAN